MTCLCCVVHAHPHASVLSELENREFRHLPVFSCVHHLKLPRSLRYKVFGFVLNKESDLPYNIHAIYHTIHTWFTIQYTRDLPYNIHMIYHTIYTWFTIQYTHDLPYNIHMIYHTIYTWFTIQYTSDLPYNTHDLPYNIRDGCALNEDTCIKQHNIMVLQIFVIFHDFNYHKAYVIFLQHFSRARCVYLDTVLINRSSNRKFYYFHVLILKNTYIKTIPDPHKHIDQSQ